MRSVPRAIWPPPSTGLVSHILPCATRFFHRARPPRPVPPCRLAPARLPPSVTLTCSPVRNLPAPARSDVGSFGAEALSPGLSRLRALPGEVARLLQPASAREK